MAEHPSALMRRAAARLREANATATPPPWRVSFLDGIDPAVDGPAPDGHIVAEMSRCGDPEHEGRQKADAALIVLLRNAAEALAGWLEAEAGRARRKIRDTLAGRWWCHSCDRLLDPPQHVACTCWDGALTVAREILGEGQ